MTHNKVKFGGNQYRKTIVSIYALWKFSGLEKKKIVIHQSYYRYQIFLVTIQTFDKLDIFTSIST